MGCPKILHLGSEKMTQNLNIECSMGEHTVPEDQAAASYHNQDGMDNINSDGEDSEKSTVAQMSMITVMRNGFHPKHLKRNISIH